MGRPRRPGPSVPRPPGQGVPPGMRSPGHASPRQIPPGHPPRRGMTPPGRRRGQPKHKAPPKHKHPQEAPTSGAAPDTPFEAVPEKNPVTGYRRRRSGRGWKKVLIFAVACVVLLLIGFGVYSTLQNLRDKESDTLLSADGTLDPNQVVSKFVELNGGLEKLGGVKSIRLEGEISQNGETFKFTTVKRRPRDFWLKIETEGYDIITGFSGTSEVWRKIAAHGKEYQAEIADHEAKQFKQGFVFFNPLVDYSLDEQKDAEYVGLVNLEGKQRAHKIRLPAADERTECFVYLDEKDFQLLRQRQYNDAGSLVDTIFDDYRLIQGFWIPHRIEMFVDDTLANTVNVAKTTLNVGVLSFFFEPPEDLPAMPR